MVDYLTKWEINLFKRVNQELISTKLDTLKGQREWKTPHANTIFDSITMNKNKEKDC